MHYCATAEIGIAFTAKEKYTLFTQVFKIFIFVPYWNDWNKTERKYLYDYNVFFKYYIIF